MEFKEFKNSTGKILKEYWLTQSEWDALDKTTVQEGDIYHIVGTIDKGDLSADVNASLAKGDSSLQKPTATLAKESFVKVGIDGTQKFDENSYVIAPSADGTVGQVLKVKADGNGLEFEEAAYIHNIRIEIKRGENQVAWLSTVLISSSNSPIDNLSDFFTAFDLGYAYPFMGYSVDSNNLHQAVLVVEPRSNGGIEFANGAGSIVWSDTSLNISIIDVVSTL